MHGDRVRSTGLHLTDIIASLEAVLGTRDEMDATQLECFRANGFIWERIIERGMLDSIEYCNLLRPGELMLDGIAGSPDLIDLATSTVIDTKCTWRSSNKLTDLQRNFWSWVVQLKGYTHMLGWQQAELWCMFVCGNWKPPMPQLKRIRLEFNPVELQDCWKMLTGHAKEKGWL